MLPSNTILIVTVGPEIPFVCRVAEEVIFGEDNVTTGASNDFMQVSRVARQMVERFGFSKKIGQIAIGGGGGNPFLGQQVGIMMCIKLFVANYFHYACMHALLYVQIERTARHKKNMHMFKNIIYAKQWKCNEKNMDMY